MLYPDFVVKYDPKIDTNETIRDKILYNLIVRRLKYKKPAVIFISADSGEGKSYSALTLQELIASLSGWDIYKCINDINVYTPLQYPEKLNRLLFPKENETDKEYIKELKKANVITVHEARTLIKSKKWQNFVNQAVSDVNAMSRSIKRMCFIIISQFIRDISVDIRYTLNYYCKIYRPLGQRANMKMHKMWKDDRDLEKPKLRKAKVKGVLLYPNGRRKDYIPSHFEMPMPDKKLIKIFEDQDYESKSVILHKIMEKMVLEMKTEITEESDKVNAMVDWYSKDTRRLDQIGRATRSGNWKIEKEVKQLHDLTATEFKEFKQKVSRRLQCKISDEK